MASQARRKPRVSSSSGVFRRSILGDFAAALRLPREAIVEHSCKRPSGNDNPNRVSILVATSAGARPTYVFMTRGFAAHVNPDGSRQELSLEIPACDALPRWPIALLSELVERCRRSEWAVTQHQPLPLSRLGPRVFFSGAQPSDGQAAPSTTSGTRRATIEAQIRRLPTALAATPDPWLPSTSTRRLPVSVMRLYALFERELDWVQSWSCEGLMALIRERDRSLVTDLSRAPWTDDRQLSKSVSQWTHCEGAETGAIVSPGLRWERIGDRYRVHLAGGRPAQRLGAMIQARLSFGRQLLVYGGEEGKHHEIALVPSDTTWCAEHLGLLVVGMPTNGHEVAMLDRVQGPLVWELPRATSDT